MSMIWGPEAQPLMEPDGVTVCVVVNAELGWRMVLTDDERPALADGWRLEQHVDFPGPADAEAALHAVRERVAKTRQAIARPELPFGDDQAWPAEWGTIDLERLRDLVDEFNSGIEDLWVSLSIGELREAVRAVLRQQDALDDEGWDESEDPIDVFVRDYRHIMRPLSATWVTAFVDEASITIQPDVLAFLTSPEWNELMRRRQQLWQRRRSPGT